MKKTILFSWIIILISFVIAVYLYPQMPDMMASHWDIRGEVNGYMPKLAALFLMPVLSVLLFALFLWLPKIDPLKKNIVKFRNYFDSFILIFMCFLFYIYLLTISWSLNYRFNMMYMIIPAIAIIFFYMGVLTENAKRNWFIGIRTPWTITNDKVWDKTNKLGGKLFKLCSLFCIVGLVFQEYVIWFVFVPVILASLYAVIYSYFEYKKQKK